MPKQPLGLRKRGNNWEYRKAIPKDVRGIIQKNEIIRSLKTSDREVALRKYRQHMLEVETLIDAARRKARQLAAKEKPQITSLSSEEIQSTVLLWFHELEQKSEPVRDELNEEEEDVIDEVISTIQSDIQALNEESGPRHKDAHHCTIGEEETDKLLEKYSISIPKNSDTYRLFRKLVIRGLIDSKERTIRSLGYRDDASAADNFFRNVDGATPPSEEIKKHTPKNKTTVTQLLQRYLKENETAAKTKVQYETHTQRFSEFIGHNTAISQITREDFVEYRDLLKEVPSNASKHFPSMAFKDIVDSPKAKSLKKLHPRTINKAFETLSMLFRYAQEWGLIQQNFAKKLQLAHPKKGKAAETKVKPFNSDQLEKIFNAPLYTGCVNDEHGYAKVGDKIIKRSRYWIPLIALYSGMRLNEICQLYVEDIKNLNGVDYIAIRTTREDGSEAPDKSLKNDSAEREVPIHPELKAMGFLDYVEGKRKAKSLRLFPELKFSNGGYSDPFQKWFRRFRASVGLESEGRQLCFHSFRHTFRDALREAEIFSEHYNRMCGWTESGSTAKDYGDGVLAETLYKHICKVSYPKLDLSHLYI